MRYRIIAEESMFFIQFKRRWFSPWRTDIHAELSRLPDGRDVPARTKFYLLQKDAEERIKDLINERREKRQAKQRTKKVVYEIGRHEC